MNIMNSPLENLDIEILDKLVWLSVVENDIIWFDSVYWELQISIPELWIINILPSCKVKDVGYWNDNVWIWKRKDENKINIVKYLILNDSIGRISNAI